MRPSPVKSSTAAAIAALCPHCGLCCNGVLFGDVELRRGDSTEPLAAAGLEFFLKGRKRAFRQPCACFANGLCRVYEDRPQQCRAFECRQVQRLAAGDTTPATALEKIQLARRHADEVRRLVRALGNLDESEPLNHRYAGVMARPIDFAAGEELAELRGELMLAVARLVETLEQDFLA